MTDWMEESLTMRYVEEAADGEGAWLEEGVEGGAEEAAGDASTREPKEAS